MGIKVRLIFTQQKRAFHDTFQFLIIKESLRSTFFVYRKANFAGVKTGGPAFKSWLDYTAGDPAIADQDRSRIMVIGGNAQDVSPRRHCLEKGIERPDDARTGRKDADGIVAGRNSAGADFPRAEDMAHHSLVQARNQAVLDSKSHSKNRCYHPWLTKKRQR
jgi:hypothetical protein